MDINFHSHNMPCCNCRRVHENEIDPCPHCDYRTKGGITQMKFHMVTVHNDKSFGEAVIYQCTYCDYKTYSKQHHRLHVKMKHEIPMGELNHWNKWYINKDRILFCEFG